MTATHQMNDLTMHAPVSADRIAGLLRVRGLGWALLIGWTLLGIGSLTMGPALGDHEVIVAQIARQTLGSGNWLVPQYLDAPFLVKPPLTPWLIAVFSGFLPHNAANGLPVTELGARLPSLLATLLTIVVVFRLARSMFERRTAWIAAFVCATAVGTMLYAVNATAEAMLTLFSTWAFAEFWWSRQAKTKPGRLAHQLRFYVALGLGMLAKGPMPLIVVCVPIAIWWWGERPTRLTASLGFAASPRAMFVGVRSAWPRLQTALTQLGLWWGVPLFLLFFVPWMILVGRQQSYAWSLWSYEYLDRVRGDYPGADSESYFYYIPIFFGMVIPWCLSLPEALVAPFLRVYRRNAKPLFFAWFWVIGGFVLLSLMSFKKSYYVLPLLPGCALSLAPVLDRLFFGEAAAPGRRTRWAVGSIIAIFLGILIGGGFVLHDKYSWVFEGRVEYAIIACALLALIGVVSACVLFIRSRRGWSLGVVGATSLCVFAIVWCGVGPSLGNAHDSIALVEAARSAGMPADAPLHWASNRPDGRVAFYGGQSLHHVIDFYELIAEQGESDSREDLWMAAADKAEALLAAREPAYVVFQRGHWDMFAMMYKPAARELCCVDRPPSGSDDHDWVVVSNNRR